MQRRWDCDQALPLMAKEKVTHFGGVPTIAWQVLEHPKIDEYDLSSIEGVNYGGAPAAPELVNRIKARFPTAQPGQGWGMTETSATAVSNGAEDYMRKPASTGVHVGDRRSQDRRHRRQGAAARRSRRALVQRPDRRARLLAERKSHR
jgi:long-chain acyl-CoA synthetase